MTRGTIDPGAPETEADPAYWPGARRLTLLLLLAWFGVTFVLPYFARDLRFHVRGWPFNLWWAAQGGLVAYLVIAWAYALGMDWLERRARRARRPG